MSNIKFKVEGKQTLDGRYNVKVGSGDTELYAYLLPDYIQPGVVAKLCVESLLKKVRKNLKCDYGVKFDDRYLREALSLLLSRLVSSPRTAALKGSAEIGIISLHALCPCECLENAKDIDKLCMDGITMSELHVKLSPLVTCVGIKVHELLFYVDNDFVDSISLVLNDMFYGVNLKKNTREELCNTIKSKLSEYIISEALLDSWITKIEETFINDSEFFTDTKFVVKKPGEVLYGKYDAVKKLSPGEEVVLKSILKDLSSVVFGKTPTVNSDIYEQQRKQKESYDKEIYKMEFAQYVKSSTTLQFVDTYESIRQQDWRKLAHDLLVGNTSELRIIVRQDTPGSYCVYAHIDNEFIFSDYYNNHSIVNPMNYASCIQSLYRKLVMCLDGYDFHRDQLMRNVSHILQHIQTQGEDFGVFLQISKKKDGTC